MNFNYVLHRCIHIILALLISLNKHGLCLQEWRTNCSDLLLGQYLCLDLNIDPNTQQSKDCDRTGMANVTCIAVNGVNCTETGTSNFTRGMPCKYTNGYSFDTALLLSIFLGMFGVDRFYLGYYAVGLAKFCTLGFLFLGQLIDIILIATQIVGPADGSYYVINYYGPVINILQMDNETYRMPQDDWSFINKGD